MPSLLLWGVATHVGLRGPEQVPSETHMGLRGPEHVPSETHVGLRGPEQVGGLRSWLVRVQGS